MVLTISIIVASSSTTLNVDLSNGALAAYIEVILHKAVCIPLATYFKLSGKQSPSNEVPYAFMVQFDACNGMYKTRYLSNVSKKH